MHADGDEGNDGNEGQQQGRAKPMKPSDHPVNRQLRRVINSFRRNTARLDQKHAGAVSYLVSILHHGATRTPHVCYADPSLAAFVGGGKFHKLVTDLKKTHLSNKDCKVETYLHTMHWLAATEAANAMPMTGKHTACWFL